MKSNVFIIFVLFCCVLPAMAQDFEILSVEHLPSDFAARKEMKSDPEGRQCALLRIATQNIAPEQREGFSFVADKGAYIVERATRDGEIWLWVSPKLKHLRVKHHDWGQFELHMQDHVSVVEALHVYKIVIKYNPPTSVPESKPIANMQYLAFQITPHDAALEVDGKLWKVDGEGGAMQYVNYGTYSYCVRASDYFTKEGEVIVDDPNNTVVVKVDLKPNFAQVTLKVDAEAEIWVNNSRKGVRTWKGQLGSGIYKVECKQDNHATSETILEITATNDGKVFNLPAPKPIYGSLNVESTPSFARIFLDGKEIGTTPKSINDIIIGRHEIKLSKEGYADHVETVTIVEEERKQVTATLSDDKNRKTFTVNGVSFTMKLVGGGTFQMGAQNTNSSQGNYDSDARNNESPVHSVTLDGYYMGETEVTQALWKAVMDTVPTHNGGWTNGFGYGDDYPAYRVSWNDVQEFILKLNQMTGKKFRLPTEAEWEYAARGGKKSKGYKYSGSNTLSEVAWYGDNSGGKTHPVKGKQPNELGIYDMSGNVWEWCSDWHVSDYYGNSSSKSPKGPDSGKFREQRGGGWNVKKEDCRVSERGGNEPEVRYNNIGFRLVLKPDPVSTSPSPSVNTSGNKTSSPSVGGGGRSRRGIGNFFDDHENEICFIDFLNFSLSRNNVGKGAALGGSFGQVKDYNLIGWYGDYNFRMMFPDWDGDDGYLYIGAGGGASLRFDDGPIPENILMWNVGMDLGYYEGFAKYKSNGLGYVFDSKLQYMHVGVSSFGFGLFVEGFYGIYGSFRSYGVNFGISLLFCYDYWPSL